MISYVLAFLAACVNATGNVLNRKASREAPERLQFRLRLFADLSRRPAWLAASGLMLVSFALAAAALGTGELSSVQLIVILELPLSLLGGAWVLGGRLDSRSWAAMAAVTAGVVGLLAILHPHGGDSRPVAPAEWIIGSVVNVAVLAALFLGARAQRRRAARAAMLGVACGVGYGLTAAFTKGMAAEFSSGGVGGVLSSWQIYACGAAGLTSTWLLQNAYHAGTLAAAQPGITLADPAVATAWGVLAFGEQITQGWILLLTLLPVAAVAIGAVGLSRSAVLRAVDEPDAWLPEPARAQEITGPAG